MALAWLLLTLSDFVVIEAGRIGIVQLGEEGIKGDLIEALQLLKGADKKDGERIFMRAWSDRTRRDGLE